MKSGKKPAARRGRRPVDPVAAAAAIVETKAAAAARRAAERDGPDLIVTDVAVRRFEKADDLVVTAAMNGAPLAEREWATLQRFAKAKGAPIVVLPLRYRNPTTPGETAAARAEWRWADEVAPYLAANRLVIHKHLYVMGDVRVPATAENPLSGFDGLTRAASGIFGHAQVAVDTIPTPQSALPKILATTGAITQPRYSSSKAGAKAEFHHTLGAVYVRKRAGKFHLRHLLFDEEGGFYDLDRYHHPTGSRSADRAVAVVTGDTHVDAVDPGVVRATYGPGGLVARLRPRYLVWHDVLDFFTGEGHWNDPVDRITKALGDRIDVAAELDRTIGFLRDHTPKGAVSVIVPSNHHRHLARWVKTADWRSCDPRNARTLVRLVQLLLDRSRLSPAGVEQPDLFAYWAQQAGLDGTRGFRFLTLGESFRLAGIELGFHGDLGPSGARGTRQNLDRTGTRSVIGHSHRPGRYRGVTQVGTSSILDPTFTRGGPSAWMHAHAALYPNGKTQLIFLIDGAFE